MDRHACRIGSLLALCLLWWPAAKGQARYRRGTVLYEQEMQAGRDVLEEYLKIHPDLVDTFYPSQFQLQSQFYRCDEFWFWRCRQMPVAPSTDSAKAAPPAYI